MDRPRVVIIGGGFGGISAAHALRNAPVELTLIDRTNHHVFQPLLYQVATATLAATDIAVPIRWLLRRQRNATVLLGEVRGIDINARTVAIDDGTVLPYDFLVVATGARHSYFGHEGWEALAPGLKSLGDALEIRRRFLLALELAERSVDPADRAALMTYVIVGGGPTGVELAGIIPDIVRRGLRPEFRRIDTREIRVLLLEGGDRLLPTYPPELSERARRDLVELGVEVRTGALVTRLEPGAVYLGDERIDSHTVFWAAGNAASPIGRSLDVPLDRAGRVRVEPDLSLPGHHEVFVIGDLAVIEDRGKPVPAVAPAANQMGDLAALNIVRTIRGEPRRNFRYRNKGDLATIGRHRAIADFGRFRLTGRLAWWFWLFVHILYLAGFRNRVSVLIEWAYAYFTYQRGMRLIVPSPSAAPPLTPDSPERPRW